MSWFLLAAVAALCYALQGAWTKQLTRFVSREAATWAIFAAALPLLAVYLALQGPPEVRARFWWVVPVNAVLYVVSFRLYVSALEVGELGITYPLLAITPVIVVPVEWALLGDRVRLTALAGILAVAAGIYMLQIEERAKSPLAPFRALAARPGARRMLGVALLWSVSGTLDRAAVLSASPAVYGVAICTVVGLALAPSALRDVVPALAGRAREGRSGAEPPEAPDIRARDTGNPDARPATAGPAEGDGGARADEPEAGGARPPASRWAVLGGLGLQGLLFAAMFVAQMEALRLSLAANVITVKRSGTLLTVLLGGLLFREEGLGRRLAGTVVVLVGVYLVARS